MKFIVTKTGSFDALGRCQHVLEWTDTNGVFRKELSKDGKPVGYRHGQYFFCNLAEHMKRLVERGHEVVDSSGKKIDITH